MFIGPIIENLGKHVGVCQISDSETVLRSSSARLSAVEDGNQRC